MNIKHSQATHEWMTPLDIVERSRTVLGEIDLDPASSEFANTRVCAKRFIPKEQDGLSTRWTDVDNPVSVFLNPPGGILFPENGGRGQSLTKLFWDKLVHRRRFGLINHAIVILFSIEALQVCQGDGLSPLDFPLCIPKRRIKFDLPYQIKNSPSHANAIVYVPGETNKSRLFFDTFRPLGQVINWL